MNAFFIGRVTQKVSDQDIAARFLKYEADDVYKDDRSTSEWFEVRQILPSRPKFIIRKDKKVKLVSRLTLQAELNYLKKKRHAQIKKSLASPSYHLCLLFTEETHIL